MPLSARARRLAVPLLAFLFGLAVLAGTLLYTLLPGENGPAASVGGPFQLVDQDGRAVTDKTFAGRPFLVFFGFTHCPDVCPTTLTQISAILDAAGERGRDLRALFITVDPERDDPATLKSYLSSFDPRIVGLTGDRAAVDAAVKAYRAYARRVPTADGDYTMEHTALVYLMDGRNRFVGSFNVSRPAEAAARDWLSRS
jgi:protein SCO1/2